MLFILRYYEYFKISTTYHDSKVLFSRYLITPNALVVLFFFYYSNYCLKQIISRFVWQAIIVRLFPRIFLHHRISSGHDRLLRCSDRHLCRPILEIKFL